MSRRISVGMAGLNDMPHVLYRHFDASDVLLYVGITMDLPKRSKQHRSGKPWWTAVAYSSYTHFATRAEAKAAETRAIKEEKPLYNDAENVYVEVAPDKADVSDTVLRMLANGQEEYDAALAKAAEFYPQESVEYRAEKSLTTYAAEMLATDVASAAFRLGDALERLLAQLPVAMVDQCRERGRQALARYEIEETPSELLAETAKEIELYFAAEYLDSLPGEEAADWRALIAAQTRGALPANYVTREAAAYAREWKEGQRYIRWGMCPGPGEHGTPCTSRATYVVRFSDDCDVKDCPGFCDGHDYFCDDHLQKLKDRQLFRGGVPALPVLDCTLISEMEEAVPF